jgi:hypothetical protein
MGNVTSAFAGGAEKFTAQTGLITSAKIANESSLETRSKP